MKAPNKKEQPERILFTLETTANFNLRPRGTRYKCNKQKPANGRMDE